MKSYILLLLLCASSLLVSCSSTEPSADSPAPAQISKTAKGEESPVHSIELPKLEADFPPGEGRDLFISRCTVCHSLRYVTMQPDFPEATWVKEVDKMRKTWGAHITEDEAKTIVSYLVTIKGKK